MHDPSVIDAKLQAIAEAIDQLFRQHLALMEAMDKMYRQGSDRLDAIEAKIDRLLEADHA